MLAQITGKAYDKEFCGGIVLVDDRVTEAAPLLKFLVGKTRSQVRKICQGYSWSVRVVTLDAQESTDGTPVQSPRSP
jgi:hypothetical protein